MNSSGISALQDQVFLGEPVGSNQPSFDFKDGIPLGASVSQKLKSKIWNHEYLDFKSLLDNKEEPLSVTITSGVINFHQGQKSKYPLTLNRWTNAFLIFSAIYLEVSSRGCKSLEILFYDQGNAIFTWGQCFSSL